MDITPAAVTLAGQSFQTRMIDGVLHLLDACGRCAGRGVVGYGVVLSNGRQTCFACSGTQGVWLTYDAMVTKLTKREKAADAKARKVVREAVKAKSELDTWIDAQDATVVAGIRAATWGLLSEFAATMRTKPLSERQMEVAAKIVAEQAVKAENAAKARATATEVGHFAAVGAKIQASVEIVAVKEYDGDYGVRYLVTMRTPEGHVLKTWNSGAFGRAVEKGQTVAIKATVKKHDDWQGTPQTELTRVVAA